MWSFLFEVLLLLFVLVPVVAKLADMSYKAQELARYTAWERTVWYSPYGQEKDDLPSQIDTTNGYLAIRSDADIRNSAEQRLLPFEATSRALAASDIDQPTANNRLWRWTHSGQTMASAGSAANNASLAKTATPGLAYTIIDTYNDVMGGVAKVRLKDGKPLVTDNGQHILDVKGLSITDPLAFESQINQWPGVVTVGIFARHRASVCLLGTAAANLAVTLGARGGLYLGGGVIARLGNYFEQSGFRAAFEAKGRFESYLANIPVWVITSRQSPALMGAARALDENYDFPAQVMELN